IQATRSFAFRSNTNSMAATAVAWMRNNFSMRNSMPTLSSASAHRRSQFKFLLALAFAAMGLPSLLLSAQAESLLLTGANVHTISGETLSPGQVLVENGKISAVGST